MRLSGSWPHDARAERDTISYVPSLLPEAGINVSSTLLFSSRPLQGALRNVAVSVNEAPA